jgi:5-methylcytosine-specific restriction endonuclease McrA
VPLYGDDNPARRPEVRAKISAAKMGHTFTAEARAKISATHKRIGKLPPSTKGRKMPAEEITRRSAHLIGRRVSTETREKIAERARQRWADPEFHARALEGIRAETKTLKAQARFQRLSEQRRAPTSDLGKRRQLPRKRMMRIVLLEIYGPTCWLCGGAIDLSVKSPQRESFSIDHVLPVVLGGTDDPANLRPAHRSCNSSKNWHVRPGSGQDWEALAGAFSRAWGERMRQSNEARKGTPYSPEHLSAHRAVMARPDVRGRMSEGRRRGLALRRAEALNAG